MLEDIIDSKSDSAVLSFFLLAPERCFSALEVGKRLRIPNLKVVHSLNKMAGQGQLKSFAKKGKRYFMVNAKYKLLPEIKSYLKKVGRRYDDEMFRALRALGNVKAAFLSGVFCGYANLPVDILLVGKINLKKLAEFLKSAEKMMGQEVNYSVMSVDEFLLRRDTFDKFIKDIFDYRHIVVVDELKKKK